MVIIMKTRILLAVLLVIGSLLAFAACGGEKDTPLTGRYVIADIEDDPDGVALAELDAMYQEMELALTDYLYMEFLEDGRFILVMFGEAEAEGMYTQDGKTLTLTAGGETATAAISGKKITWVYENGAKLTFEKK